MLLNGDQLVWNDKDLQEAFHAFDWDNKGYITSTELRYALSRIDDENITPSKLQRLTEAIKLNVHRKIDFNGTKEVVLIKRLY